MTWSRQRWISVVILIFAGQIAAIFALHTREPLLAKIPPFGPRLSGGFTTNNLPTDADELNDPLIFAGAHPQGFSGSAWLTQPALRLSVSNSIAPPSFLSFQRARADLPAANGALTPNLPLPFAQLPVSTTPKRESTLRVEGDLAARPLRAEPKLPLQIAPEVLSPTILQVAVQADGFPFPARIISRSGSRAADLSALQIANTLRFAPEPPNKRSEGLQWGNLVFQWATTEPPGTNTAGSIK